MPTSGVLSAHTALHILSPVLSLTVDTSAVLSINIFVSLRIVLAFRYLPGSRSPVPRAVCVIFSSCCFFLMLPLSLGPRFLPVSVAVFTLSTSSSSCILLRLLLLLLLFP